MKERIEVSGLFIGIGILIGIIGQSLPQAQPIVPEKSGASSFVVQSKSEDTSLQLYALSAVLMDADSGRVLYGKESDVFRPMASTTKIMTCILALENGNLQDICTVSDTAASQPKVHLGAGKGSQFYLNDLLFSLMLESHNDSAVMIAEQIGGSVEGFAEMMNQKARDIGCTSTNFVTPNGLDASVTTSQGKEFIHGTTAEDLARIMRYCVNGSPMKEEFLTITRTSNHSFTDIGGKRSYSCTNHNALLTMMPGALSGKTGFTGGAGYSYVGALEDQGRTYIIALLASGWPPHKTYKWSDARTLFQFGMDEFRYRDVFEELGDVSILVEDGIPAEGEEEASVSLTM
ncbi:MAG: D-alanyl-D-alanine carboxypeptidase family protein, partial [Lachnospiraceae bacterium]